MAVADLRTPQPVLCLRNRYRNEFLGVTRTTLLRLLQVLRDDPIQLVWTLNMMES